MKMCSSLRSVSGTKSEILEGRRRRHGWKDKKKGAGSIAVWVAPRHEEAEEKHHHGGKSVSERKTEKVKIKCETASLTFTSFYLLSFTHFFNV